MTHVIFHGDDFGLTRSFNAGIFKACSDGVLRSASLCINGTAVLEAIERIPDVPALDVGLHVNIVDGKSGRTIHKSDPLCEGDGQYRLGFTDLWRALRDGRDNDLTRTIEDDCRWQIEWTLARNVTITHLDSHRHCHAIPAIFDIVCRLAEEYGIPCVRLVREPFAVPSLLTPVTGLPWFEVNILKLLILNRFHKQNAERADHWQRRCADAFLGVLYTGHQNMERIAAGLGKLKDKHVVEVLLHPALVEPDQPDAYIEPHLERYTRHPARRAELETLIGTALPRYLEENNMQATNWSALE